MKNTRLVLAATVLGLVATVVVKEKLAQSAEFKSQEQYACGVFPVCIPDIYSETYNEKKERTKESDKKSVKLA